MHHKSWLTSQAMVRCGFTGSAWRLTVYAFPIRSYSCLTPYHRELIGLILSGLCAISYARPGCFIKRELFGAACAEIRRSRAGCALTCACLAMLFGTWLVNRDAARASIVARVIMKAQVDWSTWLACQAVFDVDDASLTVRIALDAQEIGSIQRHSVARTAPSQALSSLEIPLRTLEVASVAVQRPAVTALTWRLAWHALAQGSVPICSKWAFAFTRHTVQEWCWSFWIA